MRNFINKLKHPIENHKSAAWANIETAKPVSNVAEPSELQVKNAKDFVEDNEK